MTPSSSANWSPPGWRTFQVVLSCFVVSCLLSWATQLPERHLGESLDTLIQGALFNSVAPAFEECVATDSQNVPCIKQVAITSQDHETEFQRRSPLSPQPLTRFIEALRVAAEAGQGPVLLAVDLDLAPVDEADRVARQPLVEALVGLARHIPVVLVCPQNYHLGEPTPLESAFVEELSVRAPPDVDRPAGLRFAGATLDGFGLYYDQVHAPLGAVAARWWRAAREPHNQPLRASLQSQNPCDAESVAREHERDMPVMIRPTSVERIAFGAKEDWVSETAHRIVLLGGAYGTEDVFRLRGVDQPQYGVTLHHWILADELRPRPEPSNTFKNVVDIVVGALAGVMLGFLWAATQRYRDSFSRHLGLYAAFLVMATAVPVLLLYASVELAHYGITLSTAAMVISALFDAFQTTKTDDDDARSLGGTSSQWVVAQARASRVRQWAWRRGLPGAGLLALAAVTLGVFHVVAEGYLLMGLTLLLGACFSALMWLMSSVGEPRPETGNSALGAWHHQWRAQAGEAGAPSGQGDQGAWRRADRVAYVLWQCAKVFVVLYACTEFGRPREDWNFWPLWHLLAFGLGCLALDALLLRKSLLPVQTVTAA